MVLSASSLFDGLSGAKDVITAIWTFFSETVPQGIDFLFAGVRAFIAFAGALPSWFALLVMAVAIIIAIRIVINVL